jgi:hypothetical protein
MNWEVFALTVEQFASLERLCSIKLLIIAGKRTNYKIFLKLNLSYVRCCDSSEAEAFQSLIEEDWEGSGRDLFQVTLPALAK